MIVLGVGQYEYLTEAPPQSLHLLLSRLCSQMEVPPQSLHPLLYRVCSQMEATPAIFLATPPKQMAKNQRQKNHLVGDEVREIGALYTSFVKRVVLVSKETF